MSEEKLKELVQAVLEGKDIQTQHPYASDAWEDVGSRPLSEMLDFLNDYVFTYPFRIKPDVKVFKYKTRPYQVILSRSGSVHNYVYTAPFEYYDEEKYSEKFKPNTSLSSFKWLAPASEHEVVYE